MVAGSPTPIDVFVSYAHADAWLVQEFTRLFEPRGGIRRDVCFRLWDDRALLVGEGWLQRIVHEMQRSQVGLLLVSPSLLYSRFIKDVELPRILAAGNVVPVGLEAVDLQAADLGGLEELQIFRLLVGRDLTPRWFADLGRQNRKRFVDSLIDQMALRFGGRRS